MTWRYVSTGVHGVQEGFYQPSPERERYYNKLAESLIKAKVGSDGTINNYELNKAITQLKYEKEAGHEHNILDMIFLDERNKLDMTQVDDYKSPWKDKDVSTVNDSTYHF